MRCEKFESNLNSEKPDLEWKQQTDKLGKPVLT